MRYGVTYNQAGQVIPQGLHIPQNFALLPYVPHPLQLSGHMNMFPVLGGAQSVAAPVAGAGNVTTKLANANSGTRGRPL